MEGEARSDHSSSKQPTNEVNARKLSLDGGWRFHLGDVPSPVPTDKHIAAYMANKAGWARGAAKPNYDDSDWRAVDLPHDWSIEGPIDRANYLDNGFLPRGVGWYRRHFRLDHSDREKYLSLQFDGVSSHCTVYVNGHLLHRHLCGYTSFTVDFSDVANFDEQLNVIAVKVDATPIEGWWYEGAGIYRHAWLIKADALHIEPWGVFVSPVKDDAGWNTRIETALANRSDKQVVAELASTLLDPGGVPVGSSKIAVMLAGRSNSKYLQSILITAPQLWDIESPGRYHVRTEVRIDHRAVDELHTPFGYRTIRFDAEQGFFLNNRPVKLKGTCNHQDHAGVGVAVPDSIQEFRIRRLKEMGSNAYRCAHNPPAPEVLDACDRLGMLVMDENRTFGSSPQHLSQLRSMVLRDRNHPSVILWSICNEEAIQGSPVAANIARAMQHEVKQLDPSRPVMAAVSGGILNDDCIADSVEVMGINYQLAFHDQYHAKHPTTPLLAAETHCVLATRGTYAVNPDSYFFPAQDSEAAPWGATARATWRLVSTRPFIAGLFAWTGFDYRGEPSPHGWPCVNSHLGIMDMCGFPKDSFFLHKAFFTAAPFVHLLPHWNWPGQEGKPIRVMTYTNTDVVELFLNGESLGRKNVDPIEMAEWSVPYRAGELNAVAFRQGREVASAVVQTTGPAIALGLEVHPSLASAPILADGQCAVPVTVFALDETGRRVPTADDHAAFAIDGPGVILGVGNGDPTSHEPDKSAARSLFRGLAQVIVQTTQTPGTITLTATAEKLRPATLPLDSIATKIRPFVPAVEIRHYISDWRMSPITPTRPDAEQEIIAQDMNSWERIDPARGPQAPWTHAGGFALYRATFTPPKSVQTAGGQIVFHEIRGGSCEVYLDGSLAASRAKAERGLLSIPLSPKALPRMLTVIIQSAAGSAGLAGAVELIATPPQS